MKKFQVTEATTSFALLLALAVIPKPVALSFNPDSALAQSASPASNGKILKVDGSSSTKVTNEIRKQQIEQRSPGADVRIDYNGTNAALQSVVDGKSDLAAIGRPLTQEEKAKGLLVAPEKRHKIAIVVGSENPFNGDLSFEQFAKIFRGEITDWSEVGGAPGPIQLIDRPDSSDTRQAFQNYPVFKQAPFVAAANALKLPADTTEAVIQSLGTRGISYAIADQVTNTPGVRIVSMDKTLPDDPRYPYSQPIAYAYKGPTPSPVVAAFLSGLVLPAVNAAAIAPTAPQVAASASPQPAPAPVTEERGFPWWLLLVPLLGGLLWWLLKRSRPTPAIAPVAAVAAPAVAPVVPPPTLAPVAPVPPVALDQPPTIALYEERLVADKTRQKVGDVTIGKRIETEQSQVSVPLEKDRIVIERLTPTEGGTVIAGDVPFGVGEARMDTYEETPEIRKEAFLREEISVRKEVAHETVSAEETLRREELDIQTEGHPAVDRGNPSPNHSSR